MITVAEQVRRLPFDALARLIQPSYDLPMVDAVPEARTALLGHVLAHPGIGRWQDGWNALTGATEASTGVLVVTVDKCGTCSGRGYTANGGAAMRAISRGLPAGFCPDCRGTGHDRQQYRLAARHAD